MKRQKVRYNDLVYNKLLAKESDDSGDEMELFIKKSNRTFKEVPTVDKVLEEGDTLQSISIRYHCPIAELKRLNNIHKENEIFARISIKVPARPFSMGLAAVHDSGNTSPSGKITPQEIDNSVLQTRLENTLTTNKEIDINALIFNSNIVVSKNCDITEDFNGEDIISEEVRLLPNLPVHEPVVNRWCCNGADADISWIFLILIVVVIFAIPLVLFYYIWEYPDEFHHKPHGP